MNRCHPDTPGVAGSVLFIASTLNIFMLLCSVWLCKSPYIFQHVMSARSGHQ